MEQYRVSLSILAGKDLRDIAGYIATQLYAPISAAKKVKTIRKTINEKLSFTPQKYRLVDDKDLAQKGFRRMNVGNHAVFFVIHEKGKIVKVKRIIYGRRDLFRIISDEIQ